MNKYKETLAAMRGFLMLKIYLFLQSMKKNYKLRNAIAINATEKLVDAVATSITAKEISLHQHYFSFNFVQLAKQNKVYKICKENDADVIQGLVAFKPEDNFLKCENMEINICNKRPISLHNGIGRAMIALCCMISHDLGFDGFIAFEAKNKLHKYYSRMGATQIGSSNKFYISDKNAQKLIQLYF